MRDLSEYNDRHLGEDIFVLGNGPQLNELSEVQVENLKKKITVGVNYSHVFMDTTYWLCGHPGHLAYAIEFAGRDMVKIYQKHDSRFWLSEIWNSKDNVIPVLSTIFDGKEMLRRLPRPDGGRRIGIKDARQITYSTMHLSYILGAARVIFLGCEQNDLSHFFSFHEDTIRIMKERVGFLKQKYRRFNGIRYLDVTADLEDFETKVLNKSLEELRKSKWYRDNTKIYVDFINFFKTRGMKIISTKGNSVLTRAGASIIELENIL